jgi:site-specific DNA recombinase
VLRVLTNRIYLGELTFRNITATGCHPAIIDDGTFADAQRILAARGENYSKRAANGSDYLLTGLMRCPSCGKAMIGTRAHGRSRVYRYYTCFTRLRYDTARCAASRLDADALEDAVIAAIDRYLTAFENGALDPEDVALDPEDVAPRLAQLKARSAQLRARHEELTTELAHEPTEPPAATLLQIAENIDAVIRAGTDTQRKALIETLVAQIKITGPDRIVPVFRIPCPAGADHAAGLKPFDEGNPQASHAVRAITNLVGPVGLEPTLPGT